MENRIEKKRLPDYAAGLPAVFNAVSMVNRAMPPLKALKILRRLNQKDGIDCPGCAWPDPQKRSKLGEFCENGVKAIAEEALSTRADEDFFKENSLLALRNKTDYELSKTGRLVSPMIALEGEDHYRPITWEEAFSIVAQHLNGLSNPDKAIFYTSGRTSNEAAFLYQLFVRMYGTNNLPDCSNMCHEASGVALKETVGIGKGSVTLEDFDKAEIILVFGQNPGTNHPRMLSALAKAKANGAKIVVINPLKEVGLLRFSDPQSVKGALGGAVRLSDMYLQIRINEDVALLKALMLGLLEKEKHRRGTLDQGFIKSKTSGFEGLEKDLQKYDARELTERTGLERKEIDTLIQWLAERNKIIACWAMGLTQHENGVDNIREVVNLLLLKGSIGKPGAGTCPVRGHSNVQGDRTMGINERPSPAFLDKLSSVLGIDTPKAPGRNVVESLKAMYQREATVFIGLGGNLLSAAPDTEYTAKALSNCDLTVHVATKLNRTHLTPGKTSLLLPALGRTDKHLANGKEQFITVENSMGIVHTSHGALQPPSDALLSEPALVAGMARAVLGEGGPIDWEGLASDFSKIRTLIEQTVPGFEKYNERLKRASGFELPNGARKGIFSTENGKAAFTVNRLSEIKLEKDELLLMTIRSHDQFNTTVYGLQDRYRGISNGRMVVFMNSEDINSMGLTEGEEVVLYSLYGVKRELRGVQVVAYDLPRRCVATYFPEANVLIPIDSFGRGSWTPAYKSVKVKISKR